ncbi:MAG: hypothetical protein ACXACA_06480 [Candidatus Ranarchaeia archaeon]|jgi:hypothetical protein
MNAFNGVREEYLGDCADCGETAMWCHWMQQSVHCRCCTEKKCGMFKDT